MAEKVPAIRVTDPQSEDAAPDSPIPHSRDGTWDGEFRRPTSPASRSHGAGDSGRGSTTSTSAAIGKTVRPMPNNIVHQANGQQVSSDGEAAPSTDPRSAIDPLSQHILQRTHTPGNSITTNLLRPTTSEATSVPDGHSLNRTISVSSTSPSPVRHDAPMSGHKEKK